MYYNLEIRYAYQDSLKQLSKYFKGTDLKLYADTIISELKIMRNGNIVIVGIDFVISEDTKDISVDDPFLQKYKRHIHFDTEDTVHIIRSYDRHIINIYDLIVFLESFIQKGE